MKRPSKRRAIALNRTLWNNMAEWWTSYVARIGLDAKFFRRGGVSFDSVDIFHQFQAPPAKRRQVDAMIRKLAGPVRGKKVLDLQCGAGEGALSWANLGARLWGVDGSDIRIEEANKKAKQAGIKVTYVRSNVLRTPFKKSSFDMVYTSGGVLCWNPDIKAWAREVARVLKPGGKFILFEYHPFLNAITWKRMRPKLKGNYYDQKPFMYREKGKMDFSVETNWKVADIVNALVGNGLTLKRMEELPFMPPKLAKRLRFPHRMLLLFRKE